MTSEMRDTYELQSPKRPNQPQGYNSVFSEQAVNHSYGGSNRLHLQAPDSSSAHQNHTLESASDEVKHGSSEANLVNDDTDSPTIPESKLPIQRPWDRKRPLSTKLFVLLSLLSILIVAINILQLALLKKIDSLWWINAPPAALFVLSGILILLHLVHQSRWRDAVEVWRNADGARRTAWIGVILSVIIPLVLCQLVYMNASAIPDFRDKVWKTSFKYEETLQPPALMIIQDMSLQTGIQANMTDPGNCQVFTNDSVSKGEDCTGNVQWNAVLVDKTHNLKYHLLNPHNITLQPTGYVSVTFDVTWNSSAYGNSATDPFLFYAFLDPNIVAHKQQIRAYDCDLYDYQWAQPIGISYLQVEQTEVHDNVNALSFSTTPRCNATTQFYNPHASYRAVINHFSMLNLSVCDIASDGWNGTTCSSENYLQFSTNMITRRRSNHGTDWKKIIVDEGGIAGGVMFFTWFLGLYII